MTVDKHSNFLTFADKDGQIVHISEVENGLDCNCKCLSCGATLIAKNNPSNIKTGHFAHWNAEECLNAFETAIHKVAKKIIKDKRQIVIPTVYNKHGDLLSKQDLIFLDTVISEDEEITAIGNYSDGSLIKPDLIGIIKNRRLVIEIAVTHMTDQNKIDKIKAHKISAIEINLEDISRDTNISEIEEAIVNPYLTTWLYNDRIDILQLKKLESLRDNGLVFVSIDREAYSDVHWGGPNSDNCFIKCPNYQNEWNNFTNSVSFNNEVIQSIIKGSSWNTTIYGNPFEGDRFIYLNKSKYFLMDEDIKALQEFEKIRTKKHINECEECVFHKGIFADFVLCGKDLT